MMIKENVRKSFRSDDQNFNWQSAVNIEPGYEFIGSQKIENKENPNWPKWTIIIDYKRNKDGKN
jgi:hypothetical protein